MTIATTRTRRRKVWAASGGGGGPNLALLLRAFWSLEEATGTRVDATGRGNDLADNAGVTNAAGIVGNAAAFASASSQFLSRADNADLGYNGDLTFCAWLMRSGQDFVGGKGDNTFGNNEWFMSTPFTSGRALRFTVFGTGGGSVAATTAATFPADGVWAMACGTYNAATQDITASINAGARVTANLGLTPARKTPAFMLGSFGANFWNGRIDQAGFWNRVLSPADEAWLYNLGAGRTYAEIAASG